MLLLASCTVIVGAVLVTLDVRCRHCSAPCFTSVNVANVILSVVVIIIIITIYVIISHNQSGRACRQLLTDVEGYIWTKAPPMMLLSGRTSNARRRGSPFCPDIVADRFTSHTCLR